MKRARRYATIGLATCSAALALAVLLPLAVVVLGAFVDPVTLGASSDPIAGSRAEVAGLAAFRYVLGHYGGWLGFSALLAVASVALCLLIAVPAAWALVRHPFPGGRWLEDLAALPLSLPGLALSVALIAAWNPWRGWWLVLAGHLLYTLPFMLRVTCETLRGHDLDAWDRAARSLGATAWQRFAWIVLPNLRHALTAGCLLVFAVSWGEFNVSYLLNSGKPQTFPAALYDTFTNDGFQAASAATCLFLAVVLPAVLLLQATGDRDVEQAA